MAEPPVVPELSYRGELQRKALHLLALAVPLGMALLGKTVAVVVLAPIAVLALTGDVLRVRAHWFRALIDRWFAFMMRAEEQPPLGGPIRINGATWVFVSALVLAVIFPLRLAVPAFTMFMLADAAAALVGRRFGRHAWPGSQRTLEGSAAFLITALAVILAFPGIVGWTGVVAAVLACGAEVLPGPFNDNLRVPVVAAATLFLLERYLLGLPTVLFF